jgi:hypothetical protein
MDTKNDAHTVWFENLSELLSLIGEKLKFKNKGIIYMCHFADIQNYVQEKVTEFRKTLQNFS